MDNIENILDWNTFLEPFIVIFIFIILMLIMIVLYWKIKILLAIFILFLFSLIIGINSLSLENIPLNPYFSVFFILFQFSFLIMRSIEIYSKKKGMM